MSRAKHPDKRQGHAGGHPKPKAPPPSVEPAGVPEPPDHLREVGRSYWSFVWRAGGHAYNASTDTPTVERYCSLQDRRASLLATLDAEGFTTVGSQGQVVAHPAARLLSDVETKLMALEDRLGLSPEARLRLGLAASNVRSALDAFLEGE